MENVAISPAKRSARPVLCWKVGCVCPFSVLYIVHVLNCTIYVTLCPILVYYDTMYIIMIIVIIAGLNKGLPQLGVGKSSKHKKRLSAAIVETTASSDTVIPCDNGAIPARAS